MNIEELTRQSRELIEEYGDNTDEIDCQNVADVIIREAVLLGRQQFADEFNQFLDAIENDFEGGESK